VLEVSAAAQDQAGAADRRWSAALLAGALVLRIAYVFRLPIDSDEPQHLHVAWAWTQGLVPHRDVFDNHAPLFHLLVAPLLAAVGERADVLHLMRLAMLPLFAVSLAATWAIGRKLWGGRAGLWSAVFLALNPWFFFRSLELRTDDLWTALWLLAVAALLGNAPAGRRGLLGGFLLGAALATSQKTLMLLVALAGAAILLPFAVPGPRVSPRAPGTARLVVAALAGLLVVPLVVAALYARERALGALLQGALLHNLLPPAGGAWHLIRPLLFVPALVPIVAGARWLARRAGRTGVGPRQAVLVLAAGIYLALLYTVWPLVNRQDLLPLHPLVVVALTGVLLTAARGPAGALGRALPASGLALVALLEALALVRGVPLGVDQTRDATALIAETLALTRRGDHVLDLKGETVFRPRATFWVLERITKARLARGLLADRIPEDCVRARAAVAIADVTGFPPRTRAFLEENYVSVGRLRVAGRLLPCRGPGDDQPVEVDVVIPARYALVARPGGEGARLDGTPYGGPRFLERGRHAVALAPGSGRAALVWAQAVVLGFAPDLAAAPCP
jgi:hypothetical protein